MRSEICLALFKYCMPGIFLALYIAGPVLGQDEDITDRIKEIQQDIEQVKIELDKGEKKLNKIKSQKKKVLAEISLSEKRIAAVNNNLITINREQKSIQGKISNAEKNYNQTSRSFKDRSSLYSQRLREMYKRRTISPIGTLFTSGSVSAFIRGLKMLKIFAANDLEILNTMGAQVGSMKSSMNTLQTALHAKVELAKTRKREQNSLSSSRTKKRVLFNEIQKDEELQSVRITRFQDEYKKKQEMLDEFIRERERLKKPVPPSLEGYDFGKFKGRLSWPVSGTVVSQFGKNVDSRTKTATTNRGIEITARLGEPVCTIANGQVVMTQFFRGYGNFVMVHHPPDYYTIYGHLSDILVNTEQVIPAGTIVGLAGNTGMIDGNSPRVVLEILKSDKPQNPLSWLEPAQNRAKR